jgi:hypothetical protein
MAIYLFRLLKYLIQKLGTQYVWIFLINQKASVASTTQQGNYSLSRNPGIADPSSTKNETVLAALHTRIPGLYQRKLSGLAEFVSQPVA